MCKHGRPLPRALEDFLATSELPVWLPQRCTLADETESYRVSVINLISSLIVCQNSEQLGYRCLAYQIIICIITHAETILVITLQTFYADNACAAGMSPRKCAPASQAVI